MPKFVTTNDRNTIGQDKIQSWFNPDPVERNKRASATVPEVCERQYV